MLQPITIPEALSHAQVSSALSQLSKVTWHDGKKTAGAVAAEVKANLQADDNETRALRQDIVNALTSSTLINAIARPQTVSIMFSRYDTGAEYGLHVDGATMSQPAIRRDISFTLFLSPPASYDGGELIIESPFGEESYKLAAGSLLLYPSTSLHRVSRIERGSRIVVVGWMRSYVRDAAKRELLFELDAVKSSLFAQHGKTNEVDVLSKCAANLMRMWMED